MNKFLPKKYKNEGQTLIGLLIALAIFVVLGAAVFTLTSSSYQLSSFSRSRIAARHLAQEKMELIRNLPYDDVGTVGGIPSGPLEQGENVFRNGLNYVIKTSIVYIDDPFDGTAPADLLPVDYKRVRVDVSWEGLADGTKAPIVLVSDVAPKGIETTAGGGTLSILVFDSNGEAVPQADVDIQAPDANPVIDLQQQTNDNGRIILPGAPVCTDCYNITVSKEGYSSERTYTTAEVANPNKPSQTILDGEITLISFAIDKVSTLNISSVSDRDSGFLPIASVDFNLRGEKTIGTDINDLPVYKYNEDHTTDANGTLELNTLEWDNYHPTLPLGSGYDFAGINPLVPYSLLADTIVDLDFTLATDSAHSFWATFTDDNDNLLASVSATLSDTASYSENKVTGNSDDPDFGQVFFPNLNEDAYQLDATASGYVDFSGIVNVSGDTQETNILTAQ